MRFRISDSVRQRTSRAALLALALLCVGVRAEAQTPNSPAHPLLWKIEGGKKTSWIFGTIHLQRPDVTELPPGVREALGRADAVYTEIPADLPSMLSVMPKMMLPDGKTIDTVIGPALTAEVEKELQSINSALTLEPLEQFKPWAVAAMMLELEDQLKYPGTLALDMVIFQRAALAGKETGGIETPDEQVAALDGFTDAEQVSMVRDTLRQLHDLRAGGRSPTDFLAQLYLAGNLDQLVNELNKLDAAGSDPKLTEKLMDRLLYRRNAVMAERILKRLREHPDKSYFFAVGAAHLQGERGLLAALEKAGFRLTRVP